MTEIETENPGTEASQRHSGRAWIERKAFKELTTTLAALRQEIKALPSDRLSAEKLDGLEEQLQRYEHLLQNIEELQRTRLEIHLITQIALSLANTLDRDEVLKLIVQSLKQVVDYDAAAIFVISRDGQTLESEYTIGYKAHNADRIRQKLGSGIIGWSMERMIPIAVADVARDPRYIDARRRTRSELVVPMFTDGKVIGCLNLESDRVGAYSEQDFGHLTTFASHAAVAIERARLHHEILQKQKIEEELVLARRMQRDLLPDSDPEYERFDIAGINVPSEAVGGDYFDYITLTDKDLGIVVSDVAGKGIPAAFVMASLRAALRIEALSRYAISSVLCKVNDFLHEFTDPETFVTAFYSVLDVQTGILTYANAGHNPPILLRVDGKIELLSEGGMLLGAFPNALYHEHRVNINAGDILVLYTDGATEAENITGEQFGVEGVIEVVRSAASNGSRDIISQLLDKIHSHTKTAELQDDITLMVIKCR